MNGVICYIGKGVRNRIDRHERAARRGARYNPHLMSIIKQSGGFIPKVIIKAGLAEDDAFEIEKTLIRAVGREVDGGPLVNLTDGGEGSSGYKHTLEAIEKLRIKKTGTKQSLETRTKRSISLRGRPHSKDAHEKTAKANRGRKNSKQVRAKMSIAQKLRFSRPEEREKCSIAQQQRYAKLKEQRKHPRRVVLYEISP